MPNGRVSLLAVPDGGEPLVPEGFHCPEASTNHYLLLFPNLPLLSVGLSPVAKNESAKNESDCDQNLLTAV